MKYPKINMIDGFLGIPAQRDSSIEFKGKAITIKP